MEEELEFTSTSLWIKSVWGGGSRYTQGQAAILGDLRKFSKDKVLYLRAINSAVVQARGQPC